MQFATTMSSILYCPVCFEMIKSIFSIEKIEKTAFSFIETPGTDVLTYNRILLMLLNSAFSNEII